MTAPHTPAPGWPAWVVLAGTVAAGALLGYALRRYPGNLHDPAAPVYLALFGTVLALYLALAGWATRRRLPGRALGTLVGLAAGTLWTVEIWAGGPARLSGAAQSAVGGTFALLAVAVTLGAGILAAVLYRDAGSALRAGLFAGLTSGVLLFCTGTLMTLATLDTLGLRADYRSQFAGSGAPDMATFLVGDILAAVVAHLVINLVLGLVGGGVGALATRALGPRPATGT